MASGFQVAFQTWARRVRRRMTLRRVLSGASAGAALGALAAALLWWQRLGELRLFALALVALGALLGILYATRRRFSDDDVALYLDAKLGSEETVTTAVDLAKRRVAHGDGEAQLVHIFERAAAKLDAAPKESAAPRVLYYWHGILPLGIAATIWLSVLPLPKAPASPAPPPGASKIQVTGLKGLEKIEALEQLAGRTPEQEEHFRKLAEQARKLRGELAKGMEKREALSAIGKLRDEIASERMKFGDGNSRAGLEASLGALERHPELKKAARALGEGDITGFDQEMQKLANLAERDSREAAKEALEEAAKAAREKGAKQLSELLEQQRKLFDQREASAETLRKFAEAFKNKLDPKTREDLENFEQSGDPEAQQRLADALDKALEGLSDEERKQLAENLQKQLEAQDGALNPMTRDQLENMARRLGSEAGVEELEEQLRRLAQPQRSEDAERERGLDDAERGSDEAQRGLGAVPMPMGGGGPQANGQNGQKGSSGQGKPGGQGGGRDEGTADHEGSTPEVSGKELRAKAQARINPAAPLHGATLGRAPARAGETANQVGSGNLGSVGRAEVGAVERSDIPEEYREQVGRYFEP